MARKAVEAQKGTYEGKSYKKGAIISDDEFTTLHESDRGNWVTTNEEAGEDAKATFAGQGKTEADLANAAGSLYTAPAVPDQNEAAKEHVEFVPAGIGKGAGMVAENTLAKEGTGKADVEKMHKEAAVEGKKPSNTELAAGKGKGK